MNRFGRASMVLVALFVVASAGLAQSPSDDCSGPVTAIDSLPFAANGTGTWNNDVNLMFDLDKICAAGPRGEGSFDAGDWVYELTLGIDNDVFCGVAADISNFTALSMVLSIECASPLLPDSCVWGRSLSEEITFEGFDTGDLGLPPGTYYFWVDLQQNGGAWSIQCLGDFGDFPIFSDDFESGDTSEWTSTQPPPDPPFV